VNLASLQWLSASIHCQNKCLKSGHIKTINHGFCIILEITVDEQLRKKELHWEDALVVMANRRRTAALSPWKPAYLPGHPVVTPVLRTTTEEKHSTAHGQYPLYEPVAYRGEEGGLGGVQPPLPKFRKSSKIVPNSIRLWKLLKIAGFRTPTPQDVRKKGSNILKLPRFAIVLH